MGSFTFFKVFLILCVDTVGIPVLKVLIDFNTVDDFNDDEVVNKFLSVGLVVYGSYVDDVNCGVSTSGAAFQDQKPEKVVEAGVENVEMLLFVILFDQSVVIDCVIDVVDRVDMFCFIVLFDGIVDID